MNCKECQPFFSGFTEKALTPVVHEGVAMHLAACPTCRKDLRDFQRALAALRSTKLEDPPAGLKGAVLAAVERIPVTVVQAPPGRRQWWIAAAALLLFAAALAMLAVRERSSIERLAALEAEGDAKLEDASRETARLAEDLRKASVAEAENRRSSAESLALEGRRRQAAEEKAAAIEERVRALETKLRLGQVDAARLGGELATAQGETLRLERELAAARDQSVRQVVKAVEPKPVHEAAEVPQRPRNVIFKSRGGRLELSVRGPRDEVIPELFVIARDDSSPETADLALNALENLLDASSKDSPEAPSSRGWLDRRLEGFANALGMQDSTANAVVPPEAERAARLKALEDAWRGFPTSIQE